MSRRFRPFIVFAALLALAGAALADDASVLTETSLRTSPDSGEIAGFVTAGTAVDVVEDRGEWVRVRIEGWVRADVLSNAAVPQASSAPPAVPAVPVEDRPVEAAPPVARAEAIPAESTGVTVEGFIRVKLGRFKKLSAKQEPVLLLPEGFDLTGSGTDPETDAKLAEIEAEAARMKREAEIAMHDDNFHKATSTRDKIMKQRDVLLAERQEILNVRHGRHEAAARKAAVIATNTDSKGWFSLSPVPPGTYTVYARLTRDDVDLEWLEDLTVEQAPLQIDLDQSQARGMLIQPAKKKDKKDK